MDPALQELLVQSAISSKVTAKAIFHERFNRTFDQAHEQIIEALDDDSIKQLVIAAPRGIGKTSLASFLTPARHILFQKSRYIVPISQSLTAAMQQSENLKLELTSNEFIRKVYGDIRVKDSFSKDEWQISIGGERILVRPRGAGTQVRGQLFRNARPDLLLFDDLEDSELVASEVQRAKLKKWFYEDALNSVDRGEGGNYRIIYIDTLKHEQSLLAELLESPDWHSIRLEICDDDLKSYFPNFMPDTAVKELYDQFHRAGNLDSFYREYRNRPIAGGENAVFQQRFFKYYQEKDFKLNTDHNVENILLLDPARTTNMKSAESGLVVVGANMANNAMFIRDVLGAKLDPQQFLNEMLDRIRRFNIFVVGVEVTGLHDWVMHPIRNTLARANVNVELVELHARGGKDEKGKVARVRTLAPYYRQGLIYHNKTVTHPLEAQLLSFPRPARWDLMDALGYMPEVLQKGERFMRPYGEHDMESPQTVAEEMRELAEYGAYDISSYGIV